MGEIKEGMMISEPERTAIPQADKSRVGTETDADGHAPAGGEKPQNGEGGDAIHPVDRVYGILGKPGSTDEYLAEIRGRPPLHPPDRVAGIFSKPGNADEYLKEIRGR